MKLKNVKTGYIPGPSQRIETTEKHEGVRDDSLGIIPKSLGKKVGVNGYRRKIDYLALIITFTLFILVCMCSLLPRVL